MGAMAASADATASSMGEDSRVARWAGTFGIAGFAVFLIALPLYSIGPQPAARVDDSVAFAASVGAAHAVSAKAAEIQLGPTIRHVGLTGSNLLAPTSPITRCVSNR